MKVKDNTPKNSAQTNNAEDVWQRIERECDAMAKHAFAKGLNVPIKVIKTLELQKQSEGSGSKAEKLTFIHNSLAELVSPAKPETLLLMADGTEKGSLFLFLGRVPLIRKMMLVAISSLIALISLSLSQHINNENMITSMFDMEGTRLLLVQAILLASAAIGASFAALFKANSYVTAGSYDPKYESSYWVRFVVGLIAGIILTQLIPINLDAFAEAAGEASGSAASGVSHAALRITMALVGGFSAQLVYTVLDRIVETVSSFISPPVSEYPEIIKQALQNQFQQQKLRWMTELSAELSVLQQKLITQPDLNPHELHKLLAEFQLVITSNER